MKVVSKQWTGWSPTMKAALRCLTLDGFSELTMLLSPTLDGEDCAAIRTHPDAYRTWVVFNPRDKPIAWAILTHTNEIMVYVKRYHRRKGIGRMLLKLVKKDNPGKQITTLVWSPTSAKFYTSSARPKNWKVNDFYGILERVAA